MASRFLMGGTPLAVDLLSRRPVLRLDVNGRAHVVREGSRTSSEASLDVDGRVFACTTYVTATESWVRVDGRTYRFEHDAGARGRGRAGTGRNEIHADMPGTVIAVHVTEHANVSAGDPLLTIESMKLQLTIAADRAGRIAALGASEGQTFERGALLVAFDAPPGTTP